MYQNAGEKGKKHADPTDPPRRRANKVRGHGTWDNDRPPIAGVVGRESSAIRLKVCKNSDRATLQPFVVAGPTERTPRGVPVILPPYGAWLHLIQQVTPLHFHVSEGVTAFSLWLAADPPGETAAAGGVIV